MSLSRHKACFGPPLPPKPFLAVSVCPFGHTPPLRSGQPSLISHHRPLAGQNPDDNESAQMLFFADTAAVLRQACILPLQSSFRHTVTTLLRPPSSHHCCQACSNRSHPLLFFGYCHSRFHWSFSAAVEVCSFVTISLAVFPEVRRKRTVTRSHRINY